MYSTYISSKIIGFIVYRTKRGQRPYILVIGSIKSSSVRRGLVRETFIQIVLIKWFLYRFSLVITSLTC